LLPVETFLLRKGLLIFPCQSSDRKPMQFWQLMCAFICGDIHYSAN
jgi:hypothetical protein